MPWAWGSTSGVSGVYADSATSLTFCGLKPLVLSCCLFNKSLVSAVSSGVDCAMLAYWTDCSAAAAQGNISSSFGAGLTAGEYLGLNNGVVIKTDDT